MWPLRLKNTASGALLQIGFELLPIEAGICLDVVLVQLQDLLAIAPAIRRQDLLRAFSPPPPTDANWNRKALMSLRIRNPQPNFAGRRVRISGSGHWTSGDGAEKRCLKPFKYWTFRTCNAITNVLDTSEQSLEPFDMSASPTVALQDLDPSSRAPRRVRHEPRRRQLEVERVERIAAHMIRVTLGGDLDGFTSLGFDDHVKLFFPDGPAGAGGEPQTASRDYTPRRYDPAAKTLDIEFVLHDAGPATRWAEQAQAGQSLADRRTARLLHHPDQFRLAPADRRRHRAAGDRAAAGRAAGRHARRGPGRGGWSGRSR